MTRRPAVQCATVAFVVALAWALAVSYLMPTVTPTQSRAAGAVGSTH